MSARQRTLVGTLILAGAALLMSSTPLSACHEPTGWCCVEMDNRHSYCCYFDDNVMTGCIQR